jgi:hypothetical protein
MFSDLPELARVLSHSFVLKVCFEEEQTAFATSFIISLNWHWRLVIHKAGIYSFLFYSFFILVILIFCFISKKHMKG